jgi:hypothetical protein
MGHHGHLLVLQCSIAAARIADSNSANAVSFSFLAQRNASRRHDVRQQLLNDGKS